jgi:hypothetical protein
MKLLPFGPYKRARISFSMAFLSIAVSILQSLMHLLKGFASELPLSSQYSQQFTGRYRDRNRVGRVFESYVLPRDVQF